MPRDILGSAFPTPEAVRDWLADQTVAMEQVGSDARPWRALLDDARMGEVWRTITAWPPDAARSLLAFAAMLAEEGTPKVLADPPANRAGLAWSQYRIGEAARELIAELKTDPATAERLAGRSIKGLLRQLQTLADRALIEAEAITSIARQLSPGIAAHVRYDVEPLAYRDALANVVDGLRREGVGVSLTEQHRLVATFANIVFGNSGNAEITASSEERRWRRHRTN